MSDSLLQPKSCAVIGASSKPGKVGYEILSNLVKDKFEGEIVPVNPTTNSILGLDCYKKLGDYKENVELVIIVVPPMHVLQAVKDAIGQGARAIAIITVSLHHPLRLFCILTILTLTYSPNIENFLFYIPCSRFFNTHISEAPIMLVFLAE